MSKKHDMNDLIRVMAALRNPDGGCPWDLQQDFKSIAPYTIEEAYEVAEAIDAGDMVNLREELGDLLFQSVYHAQLATEDGHFDLHDVIHDITEKMITRHPHVFGDKDINSAAEQEDSWEEIKKEERAQKGEHSALDGVAIALPALTRAVKLQKRAAKVGFDWPNLDGVFDKIEEEIGELKDEIAEKDGRIEEEYGDIMFAFSNLGRKLKISPEEALRGCNAKFERRFAYIEKQLKAINKTPEESNLEEMDKLWNEAKSIEKN